MMICQSKKNIQDGTHWAYHLVAIYRGENTWKRGERWMHFLFVMIHWFQGQEGPPKKHLILMIVHSRNRVAG